MKLTVEFLCPECGLLTPGLAELPDGVDVRRRVNLHHKCLHCDAPLHTGATVAELLRREAVGEVTPPR